MSIIKKHISFVQFAQEQFQDALEKESERNVEFWLNVMHQLCQQLHWLENRHGNPIVASIQNCSPEQLATIPDPEVQVPIKHEPTSYAWNDGFEGVVLDNVWEE